jgi:rare lipoprotein A
LHARTRLARARNRKGRHGAAALCGVAAASVLLGTGTASASPDWQFGVFKVDPRDSRVTLDSWGELAAPREKNRADSIWVSGKVDERMPAVTPLWRSVPRTKQRRGSRKARALGSVVEKRVHHVLSDVNSAAELLSHVKRPRPEPTPTPAEAPPEPTTVHGTQYGEASWYEVAGTGAAHPWLPFGTRVTVTNLATGRSLTVVINDRGPFGGRIIDLSRAAFEALAPLGQGVMDVRVTW